MTTDLGLKRLYMVYKHHHIRFFEFLLKTDSGYLKDAEDITFTLAIPGNSLRVNTYWSALLVSELARSGGPSKMLPVSRNSNIERHGETYGQAQIRSRCHQGSSVNCRCQLSLVGRLSIGYFSMSECATGPARERKL